MKKAATLFMLLTLLFIAGHTICEESNNTVYQKITFVPTARYYRFYDDLLSDGLGYERALITAFFAHDLETMFSVDILFSETSIVGKMEEGYLTVYMQAADYDFVVLYSPEGQIAVATVINHFSPEEVIEQFFKNNPNNYRVNEYSDMLDRARDEVLRMISRNSN